MTNICLWISRRPQKIQTIDLKKIRIQTSGEACVLKNPRRGLIKFWLINSLTYAGYILWVEWKNFVINAYPR